MTFAIDDAFIREWHPRYDDTEKDEPEYQRLKTIVGQERGVTGTISKATFLDIWKWKGAMRVIGHVKIEEYETRYATAFGHATSEPPERRLNALMDLPGVGAPTGSTVIHFLHPETMPIIDVRTVTTLFKAGYIPTRGRDLKHYDAFRKAIDEKIRKPWPHWTLRQIDRALFAYHKWIPAAPVRLAAGFGQSQP
jgi:hypothetical protein